MMNRKIIKGFLKSKIWTWLFISIAISAIIFMYSITDSVKAIVIKDIQNMGADVVHLDSRIMNKEGKEVGFVTDEDLIIIKRRCKTVKRIAMTVPPDNFGGDIRIVEKDKKKELGGFVTLLGTLPDYKKIMGSKLAAGRFINNLDIKMKRRVCVLGYYTYLRCGGKKCIGKSIEIMGPPLLDSHGTPVGKPSYLPERFTIIGALQRRLPLTIPLAEIFTSGPSGFIARDENMGVFIPYTTLTEIMKVDDSLKFIWIQLKIKEGRVLSRDEIIYDESRGINLPKRVEKEGLEIINILRERHGSDKKFFIDFALRLLDELEEQSDTANKFLRIIAICAIIVSAINILSLMLFSVTTRTSEIGIRRAFGARKKDIFLQFLAEGAMICSVGIIIGLVVGILVSYLVVNKMLSWEFSIPIWGIIISSIFVFLVGILSSLYPAIRAAKIQPAEAVKYE